MKRTMILRMKRARRCAQDEDGLPVFMDTAASLRDPQVLVLAYDHRRLPVLTDVVEEAQPALRVPANDEERVS